MPDSDECGASWYAVHTRSNFEKRVAAELSTKGITHYLPAYEEVHQWKDRKRAVLTPLFPGYVFARFSDEPHLRLRVLKTAGVVRILGCGAAVEAVPDAQIEAVRRLLQSKIPHLPHPFLREGDWVRVKRGPLSGIEGILVRAKTRHRLVISVPLLSQSVAAEIDGRNVEPLQREQAQALRLRGYVPEFKTSALEIRHEAEPACPVAKNRRNPAKQDSERLSPAGARSAGADSVHPSQR